MKKKNKQKQKQQSQTAEEWHEVRPDINHKAMSATSAWVSVSLGSGGSVKISASLFWRRRDLRAGSTSFTTAFDLQSQKVIITLTSRKHLL